MKKIETDEQREKALAFLVETADELEHPLLPEEERAKKHKLFDYVSEQIQVITENFMQA